MTDAELDRKGKALRFVNGLREAAGAEPLSELPRGVPANSHECVFARALADIGCQRAVHRYLVFRDGGTITLPAEMQEFVQLVDGGRYPELESLPPELEIAARLRAGVYPELDSVV